LLIGPEPLESERMATPSLPTFLLAPSFWGILGAVLIAAEFFIPGLVVVFIGLGAWVTALGVSFHWIETGEGALGVFLASSTALLLIIRSMLARFLPSDRTVSETDEVKQALHSLVEVIEEIPAGGEGRVAFRGTTWGARFPSGSLETARVGEKVEIFGQDNFTWIVTRSEQNREQKGKGL